MSKREIAITIIGALFILVGIGLNERVLASFTSDGRIDATAQLLLIRLFNIVCIGLGIALILLRKRPIATKLLAAGAIMLIMFFIFDVLLYLSSPILPEQVVLAMSPNAQVRYFHANAESLPWVYEENVRFAKPNTELELFNFSNRSDSLGYRNPENYLEGSDEIDVVLLGDSFIWGTEEQTMADFLREEASPLSVYSLGMAGSGIPQWQYHYERLDSATDQKEDPQVVVLNFYSGNDVTDTEVFLGLQQADGSVDSADYYTFINHQYLVPKSDQSFALPKLPEFFFLANYTYNTMRYAGLRQAAEADGDDTVPICLKHREPYPEQLREEILNEIDVVVDAIKGMSPDTQIILSYVPTSGGIYGHQMDACPDYKNDIARQEASSQALADYATQIGIHYVDVTPALRDFAETEIVWSHIDHFSPEGYQIYASLLADEIESILAQQ